VDTSQLVAALVCGVLCAALGWGVPRLIAQVPEPEPDPAEEPVEAPVEATAEERRLFSSELPPAPPKELYVDIAATPRLAAGSALAAGLAGLGIGAATGWSGALLFLVPLVPVGVALLVVDWRTTLLPSWIIKPTYPALVALILLAWAVDGDRHALERAGWGWLVLGGWFLAFWLVTGGGGWGYGDVRLSGLLGLALGYLGWPQTIAGLLLIFVCGTVGALAVAFRRRSMRARVPYGPYMLVGAWLGIVLGPWLASGAGYT
jgi:leader peptidase (prepilin peptidase)/N-methyltransferase